MINQHPAHDGTRAHMLVCAYMTWNLAAKVQAMPEDDDG